MPFTPGAAILGADRAVSGNFSYRPNSQAAAWLIHQIYPQLCTQVPDCHLLLVGRHPTPFMESAAHHNPGITVTGEVPDVRPYLAAATLLLVPLKTGSGTRLKILESLQLDAL